MLNAGHMKSIVDTGILLVNLGTPTAPTSTAVRRFLREFLSDPRVVSIPKPIWWVILNAVVLTRRPCPVAEKYAKIWMEEGSPLMVHSQSIADKLQQVLSKDFSVKLAMRYGEPSIKNQLREFKQQGVKKIMVLPLYPQYAESTTSSVFDAVTKELNTWRIVPDLTFISNYFDHPSYIAAIEQQIKTHWAKNGRAEKLIFSFHGLPKRRIKQGSPYQSQCEQTVDLVVQQLDLEPESWQLVYQSRFGREEWLQPYCDKTLAQLPQEGCKSVDVICPGFSVDCLETLEEIKITNKEIFLQAGGESFSYIPALNDSPMQIDLLSRLVSSTSPINKKSRSHHSYS